MSELTCPECGADLREAGILPPGHRGRSRAGTLVLWSLAMLILSAVLVPLVTRALAPIRMTASHHARLNLTPTPGQSIHAVLSAHLQQTQMPWETNQSGLASFKSAELQLQSVAGSPTAKLEQSQGLWQITTPGNPAAPLDAAALGPWLSRQNGIDSALGGAWAQKIIQEVLSLPSHINQSTWTTRSAHSSSSSGTSRGRVHVGASQPAFNTNRRATTAAAPYPGFALGPTLIAVAVWGFGVRRIVKGPRVTASPAAAARASPAV